jgi:hypothetical protein
MNKKMFSVASGVAGLALSLITNQVRAEQVRDGDSNCVSQAGTSAAKAAPRVVESEKAQAKPKAKAKSANDGAAVPKVDEKPKAADQDVDHDKNP